MYWKEFAYHDLFFSPPFLKVLEDSPEVGIKPIYVLQMAQGECTAIYYFQLKHFNLKESLAKQKEETFNIKGSLQGLVRFNTLVIGNLLLTGNYGFASYSAKNTKIDWPRFQQALLILLKEEYDFEPSAILAKDYYKNEVPGYLLNAGFSAFNVQPNMLFHINPKWKSFDDYLESLKAKYRVRFRRAQKKAASLTCKLLSLDELVALEKKTFELYSDISENAVFNLFRLPPDYFIRMKIALDQNFLVYGYFDEKEELIAFFSCVINKDHVQAHFLGYDKAHNEESQIYLNMLYKMIELGIELHQNQIVMSRTAIEIKSSVGAVPENMSCLFLHTNSLANKLFNPLFRMYNPSEEYIIRSPFK